LGKINLSQQQSHNYFLQVKTVFRLDRSHINIFVLLATLKRQFLFNKKVSQNGNSESIIGRLKLEGLFSFTQTASIA
jgi:hypothetical protein